MKQIIPFKKDIPFNTKINEVTSISLEHDLKLNEGAYITGEFKISGEYRITDVSINEEPFVYNIPFDIALDTRYKTNNVKVDIDDFYYEVINNEMLRVNIDVLVDGIDVSDDYIDDRDIGKPEDFKIELVDDEKEDELVRKDNYMNDKYETIYEKDLFKEEYVKPTPVAYVSDENIKSLFDNFDDKDETFTTYHVHIVRQEDTIEIIAQKYNTTIEEIAVYNKVDELKLGDKLIIPTHKDE